MIKKFTKSEDFSVDITIGSNHSVITTFKNQLYTWGEGSKGKLG